MSGNWYLRARLIADSLSLFAVIYRVSSKKSLKLSETEEWIRYFMKVPNESIPSDVQMLSGIVDVLTPLRMAIFIAKSTSKPCEDSIAIIAVVITSSD